MKLLDRLVYKELLPMFGLGVAMFFSFWFLFDPVLKAGRYMALGVPLTIIVALIGWSIPPVLALTFPMGMLLSSVQGYGRLSADSEAVALYAAGLPFRRIAAPALVMGLAASLVGYVVNDRVASYASLRVLQITDSIKQRLGEFTGLGQPFDLPPIRSHGALQLLVHVDGGYDAKTKALRQVTLTVCDTNGVPAQTIYADAAQWDGGTNWRLIKSIVYYRAVPGASMQGEDTRVFDLHQTAQTLDLSQRDPTTLNFSQLRQRIALLRRQNGDTADVRDAEVQLWFKIALPFAALVFTLVGTPLGLRPQRVSRNAGFGLAVVVIMGYYLIYTLMSSMARGGHFPPALAAFLPNIIGLLVGLYLTWKAST